MERTPPDFDAILNRLAEAEVDFVIVGGYAMVVLGCDNQTRDIDFAISRDRQNAQRVAKALAPIHLRPEEWPTYSSLPIKDHSTSWVKLPGRNDYRGLSDRGASLTVYGVER